MAGIVAPKELAKVERHRHSRAVQIKERQLHRFDCEERAENSRRVRRREAILEGVVADRQPYQWWREGSRYAEEVLEHRGEVSSCREDVEQPAKGGHRISGRPSERTGWLHTLVQYQRDRTRRAWERRS